ncbi:MAG: sigma-70 family RNA polymerase sigma factor [Tannerella sp.]|jgi:RNA polymerase sigma factor (sigma-70 family)|nr:sigma-70 family RNA polymerase sigma factor [Tannerella sp.]
MIVPHEIEISVWEDFVKGRESAFSKVYSAYAQDLYSYGLSYNNNRDLIKDCIQDVFINIFNKRDILRREDFHLYLIKSFRNELYRAFRDAKETVLPEDAEEELLTNESPEELYIDKEREESINNNVRMALSILTPNQREVMNLRFIEDLSVKEIAEIMGINVQSVQNIIQRATNKIRERFRLRHFL